MKYGTQDEQRTRAERRARTTAPHHSGADDDVEVCSVGRLAGVCSVALVSVAARSSCACVRRCRIAQSAKWVSATCRCSRSCKSRYHGFPMVVSAWRWSSFSVRCCGPKRSRAECCLSCLLGFRKPSNHALPPPHLCNKSYHGHPAARAKSPYKRWWQRARTSSQGCEPAPRRAESQKARRCSW